MVQVHIELDGEKVVLKYPNRSVRRIDRELGYSAMHLLEKAVKHGAMAAFSMDDIATIIWGGLINDQPGLQVEQVVDRLPLRMDKFAPYAEKVFEIIMEIYGLEGEAKVIPEDQDSEKESGLGNSKSAPLSGTGGEPSE